MAAQRPGRLFCFNLYGRFLECWWEKLLILVLLCFGLWFRKVQRVIGWNGRACGEIDIMMEGYIFDWLEMTLFSLDYSSVVFNILLQNVLWFLHPFPMFLGY